MYKKQNSLPERMSTAIGSVYKAAYRKFYIDEIYLFITRKILFNLVGRPAAWFDRNVVDGLVNFAGNSTAKISSAIKNWQSGKVQQYAVYFLMAVIIIATVFIYVWK
jgi:NADH-quinone oxidoreductase subunit L